MHMTAVTRQLLPAAVVLLSTLGASTTALADANIPLRFRGDWQGILVRETLTKSAKESTWQDPLDTRIVISADGVKLYRRADKDWYSVGPEAFQVLVNDSNVVFTAIFKGYGGDRRWEVTWSITASLVDQRHLHIAFVRHAKNKETRHHSDPDIIWADVFYGTLVRAPDADV
jgi:hypothetical protein